MRRRRLQAAVGLTPDQAISAFRWSAHGAGLDHILDLPHFATEAEAQQAWAQVRRAVWAQCPRFRVPDTAITFDGVRMEALAFVFSTWHHWNTRFDLDAALRLLEADRTALHRHRAMPEGRAVSDYLDQLAADLDAVERFARTLAEVQTGSGDRPNPYSVLTAGPYGGTLEGIS